MRNLPDSELTRFKSDDAINPAPDSLVKLAQKARAIARGETAADTERIAAEEALEGIHQSRLLGPLTAGLSASYSRVKSSDGLKGRYGAIGSS